MRALTVSVDVPDRAAGGVSARRVAGFLDDRMTIAVCSIRDGDKIATAELEMPLADVLQLAQEVLSGDARAKTTPGLARILSASVAVLFRVSHAAGAFEQSTEDIDDRDGGHLDDQFTASGDEDPGD